MKIADRAEISPFYVMEVMKAAADRERVQGNVLHLEVGQPSTPAPQTVIAAAHRALDDHRLGYTDAAGIVQLRARIAHFYRQRYQVEVDPHQVVLTMGASGGFALAFLAAFDVGDRVAVTEPGYPCYRNVLEAFGVEVVGIPVDASSRYVPMPYQLDAAGDLDGLVIASPANPTGTMLTTDEMERTVRFCRNWGVRLVADEIYHGITYERAAPTALKYTHDAVVLQSFSKYFSMTGWRLGWMVVPEDLVRPVERLAQNLFISPPTIAQIAAIAAFDGTEELEANVTRYRTNRDILAATLRKVGLPFAPPDGAFYLYVDVGSITNDSPALCAAWLDELGIACTPGIDFDPVRGRQFVRLSYSESTEDITEAARRIEGWMTARR
ncbi:MAG: aminotransferase class I/II-fold pyridoxal phosphate-dependent enzyme [Acidimicrobiia bacterium]|nr:aminotransferase class I/II-fold pyridoxal phosphate-dependent enzyme [Acidimicrobiia bacterium]